MGIRIRRRGSSKATKASAEAEPVAGSVKPVDRLRLLKVEQEELKLAKLRGELVEREKVQEAWTNRLLLVREGLLSLRFKLPPLLINLDERQMSDVIDREVRELMARYSSGEAGGALESDG